MNKKRAFLYFLLALTAVIWGLGFVFTKQVVACMSPSLLLILRFSISALLTFIISAKQVVKLTKKQWLSGIIAGLSLGIGFELQTYAILYTSSSNTALLTGLYVVMVPFFQWAIEKKKPLIKSFIAAFFAFSGIAILAVGGMSKLNIGDLLAFLGAICFAVHCILIDKHTKDTDPMALNFIQMLTSAVLALIFGFAIDTPAILSSTFPKQIILPLLSLCILSTTFAYIVQTAAQKELPPSNVSLIMSMECTLGAVFSVMMGLDKLTWYLCVSVVLEAIALFISESDLKKFKQNFKANKNQTDIENKNNKNTNL